MGGCPRCGCPATCPPLTGGWSEIRRLPGPHTWYVWPHRSPSTTPRAGRGACPPTPSHGGTRRPPTRRPDNAPRGPGSDNIGGRPDRVFPLFGEACFVKDQEAVGLAHVIVDQAMVGVPHLRVIPDNLTETPLPRPHVAAFDPQRDG